MKLTFTVRRDRFSVTQGEAVVLVNGTEVIRFGDTIEQISADKPHYGPVVGNWASVVPDGNFIKGLLYHPYDSIYHYSDKIKEILESKKFNQEN